MTARRFTVKKMAGAVAEGLEALMRDPGFHPPRIKTGRAILSPSVAPERDLRAVLESALARPRVVVHGTEPVPYSRTRAISKYIEERWEPVHAVLKDDSPPSLLAAISQGQAPIEAWKVTQHVVIPKRGFAQMSPDEIREHVLSLQQAPSDAYLNGVYPTLKGRRITGGRREYREATKGMVLWGSETNDKAGWTGHTLQHLDRISAERTAKKRERLRYAVEKWSKQQAPRKLGEL